MSLEVAFRQSLDDTQRSVHALGDSGSIYTSPYVQRHLGVIDHGVRHLRFDDRLLQDSDNWRRRFPQGQLDSHRLSTLQNLQEGAPIFHDYKASMNREHLSSLRDNQIMQNHEAALGNIATFRRGFDPNAKVSYDRVQGFCDYIGVTDRYTGYRNNLSRGSRAPLHFDPVWKRGQAAKGDPPLIYPKFQSESVSLTPSQRFNVRCKSVPAYKTTSGPQKGPCCKEKSPQEMAGINMNFPGISEYRDRYPRPFTAAQRFYNYNINPKPDFTLVGRSVKLEDPGPNESEYGTRYTWPDASKLNLRPWQPPTAC